MNPSALNYHLATIRAADLEHEARLHVRETEAVESRRRGRRRRRRDRAASGMPRFAA